MATLTPSRLNLLGLVLLAGPWAAWLLLAGVALAVGATPPDLARPVGTTNGWLVDLAVPVGLVFTFAGLVWGAAERRSAFDGWREMARRPGVETTGETTDFLVAGELPNLEVERDGRTALLRVATRSGGPLGPDHTTVVQTPLHAVRRDGGAQIRSPGDPNVGLDRATRSAVDDLLSTEPGVVTVDDTMGLVRYEADRPIPDADGLDQAVDVVSEVAESIEARARSANAGRNPDTHANEDSASGAGGTTSEGESVLSDSTGERTSTTVVDRSAEE